MTLLNPGDAFPPLTVSLPGGETLDLPAAFAGEYAVVLLFRGSWCPYCNAQLRAFERARDKLGARVVALSVDDEATTRELIAKHDLSFPVGHSADAAALHESVGAFVTGDHLESTGFVLGPDGRVLVSVYSSQAIGRLVPEDVAGFISYVREHAATAA